MNPTVAVVEALALLALSPCYWLFGARSRKRTATCAAALRLGSGFPLAAYRFP